MNASKMLSLDRKTYGDLVCLQEGFFAPLSTFMGEASYLRVCEEMRLEDGTFFPLPITLSCPKDLVDVGDTMGLTYNGVIVASLTVREIFQPNLEKECLAYGTSDTCHPYVWYKQRHAGSVYVTGEIDNYLCQHEDFLEWRRTAEECRRFLRDKTVIGFQTRNPMHRAHFEATVRAVEKVRAQGKDPILLISPVVGETQKEDVPYPLRVACYRATLPHYEKRGVTAYLTLLPLTMRMAGPREACLHALVRRNMGCTHFIVGRDHAGPSCKNRDGNQFYGPLDARMLAQKHQKDLGIAIVGIPPLAYSKRLQAYVEAGKDPGDEVGLSGTEVRRRLAQKELLPDFFTFPEVAEILRKGY